jgi:amino acid transporter
LKERETLQKTLKPHWVWAIALGSAIGWGCFVLPTGWLDKAGPLGAIIGLLIGGLIMMIIAVSYGFMIEKFPVSGGEFAYAYLGFGRNHAFICGWFLTLGYICIVALNASALALLGKFIFPKITNVGLLYEISGWEVYFGEVLIATVALLIFAYLNIKGATISGKLQFIFCLILVLGVILLTISMVLHPATSIQNLQPLFKPGVPALTGIIAIIAIAPWAYVGFDNIPQAAEEFDFSPRKAFSLIIYSIIAAGILYSFMVVVTAIGYPWQQLVEGKPVWGTGEVVSNTLGIVGMLLLAISLCMGVFTGLNGFYVSSSRIMFAMGRAQILPSVFSKLHPKYNTPYMGVIFTCIICLFAPWFGREALLWVVDMSAIGVTIAYFYTCFAAFNLFKWSHDGKTMSVDGVPVNTVSPIKKILALLGALSGIIFLGLLLVPSSPSALGMPSLLSLLIWVLLGIAFYLYKGKEFQKIPKKQLDYYILGKTISGSKEHHQLGDTTPPTFKS